MHVDAHGPAGTSRFHTADLDEARECTSRTFSRHDVRLVGGNGLDFRLDLARSQRLTVGQMAYGAEATVQGPPMEQCYHLNLPMTGTISAAQHGVRRTFSGGDAAIIFRPGEPFVVLMSSDSWQYHLKLPKETLEAHASKLAGARAVGDIEFDLTFDLTTTHGRALLATVGLLYDEFSREDGLARLPAACRELESAAMTSVLMTVPSQLTTGVGTVPARTRRSRIREVMDYVDDRAGSDVTTADLAAMAGMSLRALQAGFHDVAGVSPTAYLRAARLDRVHADLTAGASVTDAATRWGFYHLGRFAQHYRRRFGMLPSDTARRTGPPRRRP
ncbi:AraC family transcriptional regulator [Pseudonocardia endophytica]|uniref:AraC family transcriptional regulator n=1 Tax=Pseudonocardia endophytica TaxID=401976 RepID=A0A4R1I028_PSEEN|nr:AraC family transcriptional regulator [Pseudonocardia endophytica]TCK25779.1 AraC family transcriptional regulator [Pseudonocardia endophytica]